MTEFKDLTDKVNRLYLDLREVERQRDENLAKVLALQATVRELEAKPFVTYIANHERGPSVVYLSDGRKISVARESFTIGPAWLKIEPQLTLHPCADAFTPCPS